MPSSLLIVGFLLLGLLAGVLSGIVGIGGGTLIVPILVLAFGFSQQTAQGTTLALLLPPIGLLAAWAYYQEGFVDVRAAAFIAIGFLIGGLVGGRIAVQLPTLLLQRVFGFVLLVIAVHMMVGKR